MFFVCILNVYFIKFFFYSLHEPPARGREESMRFMTDLSEAFPALHLNLWGAGQSGFAGKADYRRRPEGRRWGWLRLVLEIGWGWNHSRGRQFQADFRWGSLAGQHTGPRKLKFTGPRPYESQGRPGILEEIGLDEGLGN